MPTDFWPEKDDRPPSRPRPRWPWWHVVALAVLLLLAVAALIGVVFPENLAHRWHRWQVRQFRQDIVTGTVTPEELGIILLKRDDGLLIALKLSEDPDPRVRAASIARLVARGTAARKQEPGEGQVDHVFTTLSDWEANDALKRLLDDPDPMVRQTAIRAVSSIQELQAFTDQLLNFLNHGSRDERLIVSYSLAAWNGDQALKTFANTQQPKEVRIAALDGMNRFGWARVVENEGEFVRTMKQVQADPDPTIRKAATDALRLSRIERPK